VRRASEYNGCSNNAEGRRSKPEVTHFSALRLLPSCTTHRGEAARAGIGAVI
jgi:hypothetical protein